MYYLRVWLLFSHLMVVIIYHQIVRYFTFNKILRFFWNLFTFRRQKFGPSPEIPNSSHNIHQSIKSDFQAIILNEKSVSFLYGVIMGAFLLFSSDLSCKILVVGDNYWPRMTSNDKLNFYRRNFMVFLGPFESKFSFSIFCLVFSVLLFLFTGSESWFNSFRNQFPLRASFT